jgi:hypothetical protein
MVVGEYGSRSQPAKTTTLQTIAMTVVGSIVFLSPS